MSNDTLFPTELNRRLNEALEPYFAQHYRDKCYIGLIFQQGKRKMVQINVPAHDLPTLLQAKPSDNNDPDSGKNRPEVQGHVEEVKDYIIKRIKNNKPWILGTLTANIAPNRITITELARGICFVVIPRGVKLDITDGQHRKRAIHELIESPTGELIGDNDFPITLVLEENFNQCQTDFKDMAQTRSLDKSLLLSFGEFEGKVGIVKNLIKQVFIFKNKTERIKDTPTAKKKLLYTANYIVKLVSFSFTGKLDGDLEDINVEEASKALSICLNQFFSECAQTRDISRLQIDNLTVEQINKFKVNCILGRSVGLEVLGRLIHGTYEQDSNIFNSEQISQLAKLDWSTSSELWRGNIVKVNPNSKNAANPYRISATMGLVQMAIDSVKNQLE
ncbi:DNA sulfur modification protein DndB [Chroococcus sp. FPU101]|uniref:DNA sulfur modification protein DndB n=1 Tax=Chroococcus sp. FPU101 TaxID=1974212 RepID=UPI001A8F5321|nr:DNA sulfur modification protein DndB [Chroococcus sp. FPU101]